MQNERLVVNVEVFHFCTERQLQVITGTQPSATGHYRICDLRKKDVMQRQDIASLSPRR